MDLDLFKQMLSQSPWLVLFVWLLIKTMAKSEEREMKLQEDNQKREANLQGVISENQKIISENQKIMGDLARKFDVVENIQDDVKEIKIKINGRVYGNEQVY